MVAFLVLKELKDKIQHARVRAALSVNKELLQTYWDIGSVILQQQKLEGWGTKVIERLAKDLKFEFPDFQGLSVRNFKYMRAFAETYPHFPNVQEPLAQIAELNSEVFKNSIVQAPLAQLTWYHHITLLEKIKDPAIRLFYIFKTIETGWSRNVLVHQIEAGLHNLQQLDEIWKDESEMKKTNEISFDYRLFGFRKAGTENYSAQIRLRFEINTYWYGFSVTNYNNNQPFLKKLYHQILSDEDKQTIVDHLSNNMLDQIEWIIGRIESGN